ncbi:hypothetical protein [Mycobacterium shimoidei]|uniref:Uncharacterized protein n=1 Tax=Mycobacterium shimoidei TaxID=29313 RepID=A0A375Z517_MYCSH|nr:hypothetical protein [Mycobacterium shimoidei]MCV7257097.1 hypothetical protein [Mycobacterium shimoidei]SRX96212.1 hypothetical protein MSP7336_04488 [Mycobacterium shimoidei]
MTIHPTRRQPLPQQWIRRRQGDGKEPGHAYCSHEAAGAIGVVNDPELPEPWFADAIASDNQTTDHL